MILVFFISLVVIFLEITLFHSLQFLTSYLESMVSVSAALLGLAAGGWAAFLIRPRIGGKAFSLVLLGLVVSVPFTFWVLTYFSSSIFGYSFLLLMPFMFGSLVLCVFFMEAPSDKVYCADLVGAGIGAILACIFIENFGEEIAWVSSFLLISGVALVFHVWAKKKIFAVLFLFLFIAGCIVLIRHCDTDFLNFARIARSQPDGSGMNKVYNRLKAKKTELIFSGPSVVGRVDAITFLPNKAWGVVFTSGLMNDTFKVKKVSEYEFDPRIPKGFLKDPDTLIIGTSAEGVVNPIKGLGDGKIIGIEINPAKVKLMQTALGKKWSYDAYQHLNELHIIDVRNYLYSNRRQFDHITLMNSHLGHRQKRTLQPEYTHTVEAIQSYFEHLKPNGLLNIEETDYVDDVGHVSNARFASTLVEALKRFGVKDPGKHLYIFKWGDYMQFFVKRSPFTDQELSWLDAWSDKLAANVQSMPFVSSLVPIWHPRQEVKNPIAEVIRRGPPQHIKYDLSPVTDDRPFLFDILKSEADIDYTLYRIGVMALIFGLIPVLICAWSGVQTAKGHFCIQFAFFGTLGIAYMMIEIMLIQRYQILLGSPTFSLIAVIGSMLFFSGLGSYFSPRFAQKHVYFIFAAIALLSLGIFFAAPYFMHYFAFLPAIIRTVMVIIIIAPLGFFMGMPFPIALGFTKESLGERTASIMFSVNSAFSALAVPISYVCSAKFGFAVTFLVGLGLYAGLMLCLRSFKHA